MKRILVMLSILGLATIANVGVAEAHQPNVSASCRGLVAVFTDYPGINRVAITVDGATAASDPFTGSVDFSRSWDPTLDHSWQVVVDAADNEFDESFGGSVEACVATTTAPVTTTTAAATTSTTSSTSTTIAATTTSAPQGPTTTTVRPTLPATGFDPLNIGGVALVLLMVGCIAAGLAARRRKA